MDLENLNASLLSDICHLVDEARAHVANTANLTITLVLENWGANKLQLIKEPTC